MSSTIHTRTPEQGPPRRGATRVLDVVAQNPYGHFALSEFWAGMASGATYAVYHAVTYFTQSLALLMPLHHAGPAALLESSLHWAGAVGGGGTFVIVTLYQMWMLIKRLAEEGRK